MKKNSLFACAFLSFYFTPLFLSAQYYDNQWVFGYDDLYTQQFGLSKLDFNGEVVKLSYNGGKIDYHLDFGGSILCNKAGRLKFHTNNCAVYDSAWNRISGPDIITPTGEGAQSCGSMSGPERGYGCEQSSILLPDLKDSTITYVLHKDMVIDFENQDLFTENFYFSTIHEQNDGTFIFETEYTINSGRLDLENLTALPNKAKDGWWVVLPRQNSNVFERFLIKSDTVYIQENQEIGLPYISVEVGIGQAQYSPGGKYFAINTENYGVLLYEFDNETGLLSNFRRIPYPNSGKVAQGLCFSPNERFVYVTNATDIYQIDLESEDEVYHVAYVRSRDETGWPVGLGMIFQGPDCRLYVSPGSTTYYLHVIMEPDKKGAASEFIERGIELPTIVGGHLPNIAQYRYLTGCDSSKEIPFVKTSIINPGEIKSATALYPNPAHDLLSIKSEKPIKSYTIYSIYGQLLQSDRIQNTEIDISGLSSGTYFLSIDYVDGGRRVEKFVKM